MSTYIYAEAELIKDSFILGMSLMISYDLLRFFRFLVPHNTVCVGIEDFFYWIYSGFMTFRLLFLELDGVLRGYVILAVFAGMILYDRIVSQTIFELLKKAKIWFTIKVRGFINRKKPVEKRRK